MKLTGAKM